MSTPRSVHPHIRGAYRLYPAGTSAAFGSSPHTWGILSLRPRHLCQQRFIPTYVGHTPARCGGGLWPPVHPHLRGAYLASRMHTSTVFGSSPPTWGIPYRLHMDHLKLRFIPTYVGHTSGWGCQRGGHPVHPHLRGAYGGGPGEALSDVRFIPTYVGHTGFTHFSSLPPSVHPHLRGAYAASPPALRPGPVHPHLRGAYMMGLGEALNGYGSSPPTWGIRGLLPSP